MRYSVTIARITNNRGIPGSAMSLRKREQILAALAALGKHVVAVGHTAAMNAPFSAPSGFLVVEKADFVRTARTEGCRRGMKPAAVELMVVLIKNRWRDEFGDQQCVSRAELLCSFGH